MNNNTSNKNKQTNLTKAITLGFLLSTALKPNPAKAYYALGIAVLASTTTSVGLGIAGGVLLTMKTDDSSASSALGDMTRGMIDAALISSQTDLDLQFALLCESPTALAQFGYEIGADGGPAVAALSASTGLPPATLRAAWERAIDKEGQPASQEGAARLVSAFMMEFAPSLQATSEIAAAFAWRLAREQSTDDEATAAWLAGWLGVAPEAVRSATQAAIAKMGEGDTRTLIYRDPAAFLDEISRDIEAKHPDQIHARFTALKAEAEALLAGRGAQIAR